MSIDTARSFQCIRLRGLGRFAFYLLDKNDGTFWLETTVSRYTLLLFVNCAQRSRRELCEEKDLINKLSYLSFICIDEVLLLQYNINYQL